MLNTPPLGVATPTEDTLPRRYADFAVLGEALAYAAQGARGVNFYDARGELQSAIPYSVLHTMAQADARRLWAAGLTAGDRVALVAATVPEFISLFLGATLIGVLPVPLPVPTSFGSKENYVQQIRTLLSSCQPSALIGPEGLVSMLCQSAEDYPDIQVLSWGSFAAFPEKEGAFIQPKPSDVCYLQYSSGSTRFPHGIVITHQNLLNNCMLQSKHGTQVVPTDRCISWLPFYHDMGLVGNFLAPLACQMSLDMLPTDDFARRPLVWLKMISANKGTSISYSPTFGYDIAARRAGPEALKTLDLSRWRVAGNGGDMIRPDVMQRFTEVFAPVGFNPGAFVPSYGLAESTLAVSFMPVGEGIQTDLIDERILKGMPLVQEGSAAPQYRAIVNCGKPMPGYDIEIRDGEGQPLAERQIGKLYIRGPSVMAGYFRDDVSTRACLSPDGWLDTGDMAYLSKGSIYIVGRAKDMIIINGRNHWPQDIEWAVEQMPGLRNGDIAAFAITAESGEEVPTVLVQCRVNDSNERAALKADVTAQVKHITGMNCLVELVPPKSLPRTSSGKLSRSKARTLYLAGALLPIDAAA